MSTDVDISFCFPAIASITNWEVNNVYTIFSTYGLHPAAEQIAFDSELTSNYWTYICLLRMAEHLVAPISKCPPERRINLPWTAAEITYDTKLLLPETTIENRMELLNKYKASSSFNPATSKVYIQGPKLALCIQKQELPKQMTEGCACSNWILWIPHIIDSKSIKIH